MGYKIAVMGTGAVGGYAGAHMARNGEDITFIDPWPEHVETMRSKGLKISHIRDVPEWTTPVRALHVTDAQQLAKEKPVDIAFVCMKSYDTQWATTLISQYLSPNGFVVSLQNCMNEETIASVVGWGRVVGCIASSITSICASPATSAVPRARAATSTRCSAPARCTAASPTACRRSAGWSPTLIPHWQRPISGASAGRSW
jgi:2-dehydropantoate 2-reductase